MANTRAHAERQPAMPGRLSPALDDLVRQYAANARSSVEQQLCAAGHADVWQALDRQFTLILNQRMAIADEDRDHRSRDLVERVGALLAGLAPLHAALNRYNDDMKAILNAAERRSDWRDTGETSFISHTAIVWASAWHLVNADVPAGLLVGFFARTAADELRAQHAKLIGRTADPRDETVTRPSPRPAVTLNGRGFSTSILGTWIALVGLSWVSLIWGALISAPVGVGIGVAAMSAIGLIVVPVWGTAFGFLGMARAQDSTLRTMNFSELPRDHALVSTCAHYCRELSLSTPRLGTIDVHNAFAMGASPQAATVAIGTPLMKTMSPDEVNAILAHELGHVVSGDMRRMMLMRTFQNATVWFAGAQGLKQGARWIICWAAELAILAFSRKREYWADAVGAALAGKDAMIGALRKLDQAPSLSDGETTHARFMVRGRAGNWLSTHPTTAERIRALETERYIGLLPRARW